MPRLLNNPLVAAAAVSRRSTIFALILIGLLSGIAAPALALAGYRFFLGDGFSFVAGLGVMLVILLVAAVCILLAIRFRH